MTPSRGEVIGVILAAGKGTRIQPLSELTPKPILPVCNRPLLDCQLEMMKACGISEVLNVIGNLGYAIVNALGDGSHRDMKITYVEQTETLGMAHALGRLETLIASPIMLFLGDIYFVAEAATLREMIAEVVTGKVHANLITRIEPDPEAVKRNFAVIEDGKGRVLRVVEKPRYVENQIKGCGLYIFDQRVFDAIRRTPRTAMRDEYEITESIQLMINDGYRVHHRSAVEDDINLTYPTDLLRINLIELERRGLENVIGRDVIMADGTVVENSVIGDEVVITHPIRIRNSVIFPRTTLDTESDVTDLIKQGDVEVQCGRTS